MDPNTPSHQSDPAAVARVKSLRAILGAPLPNLQNTNLTASWTGRASDIPKHRPAQNIPQDPDDTNPLPLSLLYIHRPPHSITCILCKNSFHSTTRMKSVGIKILGCGMYMHVGCFEEECKGPPENVGAKGDGKCGVCVPFWTNLKVMDEIEREEFVQEFLDGVVPWRRGLGVGKMSASEAT